MSFWVLAGHEGIRLRDVYQGSDRDEVQFLHFLRTTRI